jgi:hypothetical protein
MGEEVEGALDFVHMRFVIAGIFIVSFQHAVCGVGEEVGVGYPISMGGVKDESDFAHVYVCDLEGSGGGVSGKGACWYSMRLTRECSAH